MNFNSCGAEVLDVKNNGVPFRELIFTKSYLSTISWRSRRKLTLLVPHTYRERSTAVWRWISLQLYLK